MIPNIWYPVPRHHIWKWNLAIVDTGAFMRLSYIHHWVAYMALIASRVWQSVPFRCFETRHVCFFNCSPRVVSVPGPKFCSQVVYYFAGEFQALKITVLAPTGTEDQLHASSMSFFFWKTIFNSSTPRQNGHRFSGAFASVKSFDFFLLKLHWRLFLSVQLTISQHWFR